MTKSDRELLKERLEEKAISDLDDGYMTSAEISREMNWSDKRTLAKLRELKELDELDITKVKRFNLANTLSVIPGYRLKRQEG